MRGRGRPLPVHHRAEPEQGHRRAGERPSGNSYLRKIRRGHKQIAPASGFWHTSQAFTTRRMSLMSRGDPCTSGSREPRRASRLRKHPGACADPRGPYPHPVQPVRSHQQEHTGSCPPGLVAPGKARSFARTVSAMRDLQRTAAAQAVQPRTAERTPQPHARAEDRLPAPRPVVPHGIYVDEWHRGSPPAVLHQDLGPARANETVTDRVTEHLRAGDALLAN